jgi:SAM-dependent methyltransferase
MNPSVIDLAFVQTFDSSDVLKSCCAQLYESNYAKLLLGDSFHPGGLELTERLGELLQLQAGQHVLDVAAGKGGSAIRLAQRFGCAVIGVDYGAENVREATACAAHAGLAGLVRFEQGDAECLQFDDGTFDAVICECAFCTFPDKRTAAAEFARVLKMGGRVGLSDLTRNGPLPSELESLLAWVACIADAQPIEQYLSLLGDAGFAVAPIELHDDALLDMVNAIRGKLLGVELLVALQKLTLPGVDFTQAKTMARSALDAIKAGKLGYALIAGQKSG